MNFPAEIIDHILYFTKTKLYILKQVNRYFRKNCFRIRFENIIDINDFDNLFQQTVFTYNHVNGAIFHLIKDVNLTDDIFSELINLKFLELHYDNKITNKGISELINLKFIDLSGNPNITDEGLSRLTNLTKLNLRNNKVITDKGLQTLTKLVKLNVSYNNLITDNGISNLTNLTSLNVYRSEITNYGITALSNLKILRDGHSVYDSEEDENDNYIDY